MEALGNECEDLNIQTFDLEEVVNGEEALILDFDLTEKENKTDGVLKLTFRETTHLNCDSIDKTAGKTSDEQVLEADGSCVLEGDTRKKEKANKDDAVKEKAIEAESIEVDGCSRVFEDDNGTMSNQDSTGNGGSAKTTQGKNGMEVLEDNTGNVRDTNKNENNDYGNTTEKQTLEEKGNNQVLKSSSKESFHGHLFWPPILQKK